ncbi:MAG: lipoyl(octanoyl) transferase LipB [Desulfobulbus sp.]|nr:lipoyl(octanoyl) transferase LipB [Desulfobulbus sp.]
MAGDTALCCDLGLVPYAVAHRLQLDLVERRISGALDRDLFLLVEHPLVFTLGRNADRSHLGLSETVLLERGAELVRIERGGEVTCHNPGQLVVYPIIHLRAARLAVRDHVARLEEVMLRTAADRGVVASRDPRNRGVWTTGRKLGSVGVAVRHGVAFHGLALNVVNDLEPFAWINPCGLAGVTMTSLARECGRPCALAEVKTGCCRALEQVYTRSLEEIPAHALRP